MKAEEGFKEFAIITQRNVFNANRSPASTAESASKPPRPPRIEAFALLGTMSSERGAVAFFDGTSAMYRKAAQRGDTLGSFTVGAIEHDRVTLKAGVQELRLPMRMQFRREDQGEWQLGELPDDFQPTTAPPPGRMVVHKPDPKSASPEEMRDYVLGKYERKLEQYANDPEKSEKLMKSLQKEIEGRVKKLEKLDRRMQ